MGYLVWSCPGVTIDPLNITDYCHCSWFPTEFDKTLFLKISQAHIIEHGAIKLVLIWKHHLSWQDFTVLEGFMQGTVGGSSHQSCLAANPVNFSRYWPDRIF